MRATRLTAVRATPDEEGEQVTQLLAGDRVEIHQAQGTWARVTVSTQPSSKDPSGYPGWVALADLAHDEDSVVEVARGHLGTPYAAGGLSDAGLDAAGLVHLAFRTVGITVPRDAADQAAAAQPVERGSERPGDLWFFSDAADSTLATHVGLVTGPDTMLHVAVPTDGSGGIREVVEETVAPRLLDRLVAAGRFGAPEPAM